MLNQSATDGTQTHVVTGTVNAADWPVSGSDDGLATNYGYDAAGRQRQETVQSGAMFFTTQLDSEGRATQIAEGMGTNPVGFTYNADNLVTQATYPGGVTIGRTYDGANRLTQATIGDPTAPLTNTYKYAYDPTGWLNSINSTILSGASTGNLVGSSVTAPSPTNLTSEGTADWAHWGLHAATTFDHKAGVSSQISNYMATGGTAGATNSGTSYSWSDGTPDASSAGTSTAVNLTTLHAGFSLTVPASTVVRTLHLYIGTYYAQGSLVVSLSDGSAAPYTDTFDNPSSYSSRDYTFVYNAASSGQTLNISFSLGALHSGAGQIWLESATLLVGSAPVTTALTHDGLGHLTGASDGVHPALIWTYDGQGNLLHEATGGTNTTAYTYTTTPNTANELQGLGVTGQPARYYTYDHYGNPLSIGPSTTNPCPSATSTCLGYDAQARLTSVVEPSSGPTIAMTYNAAGLRANYTVTPYGSGSPTLSEQFTYRGGQLAQTVVVSGTTTYTDTYVYSQHGMPLELLRATPNGTNRYWYERDGLGNVVALTDVSGNVVDQYAYDVWGKPTLVQETVSQQLRYQGYWYDNELGWYWLTTRSYDPSLKRFLQPDPSQHDGLFSYVYVGDDPVDMNDPSGFDATPMYCDSRCQTLIVLDNVMPPGMSPDQFKSYGGNLNAPVVASVNTGTAQNPVWTQIGAMRLTQALTLASQKTDAASSNQNFDRVAGNWGIASLLIKQVSDGTVQLTASLIPYSGTIVSVDWQIGWRNVTTGEQQSLSNPAIDFPLIGRLSWPEFTYTQVWHKATPPWFTGQGTVVAVFVFSASLVPDGGDADFPITVGGDPDVGPVPTVRLKVS